jgi:hypothetical protein
LGYFPTKVAGEDGGATAAAISGDQTLAEKTGTVREKKKPD